MKLRGVSSNFGYLEISKSSYFFKRTANALHTCFEKHKGFCVYPLGTSQQYLSWDWPGQGEFSPEGTQPGRLTQPGQTEQGIRYHVPSCWAPVGGSWAAGRQLRVGSASTAAGSESGSVHSAVCFMYSSYLYCCNCSLCLLLC